jgi:competence protein ComEC
MPRRRTRTRPLLRYVLLLALLATTYALRRHHPRWRPGPREPVGPDTLRITFADVEQGDAILIQIGETDLLIDAGPHRTCRHLSDVLQRVHGDIEYFVITHPHDDHYGCAPDVLRQHTVKRLITNGERRGPPRDKEAPESWMTFESSVRRAHLQPETLQVGDILTPAPGLTLEVLATGGRDGGSFPDSASGEDINNDSLVFMLEFGDRRVLLSGDIETAADRMLVKEYCLLTTLGCPSLQADVLKVPHHGSADFDPEFFQAVHPRWAVISADYASRKHYLPRAGTVRALKEVGATVFSTSAAGTEDITLTISPKGEVSWQAPESPVFAWDGRNGVSFTP